MTAGSLLLLPPGPLPVALLASVNMPAAPWYFCAGAIHYRTAGSAPVFVEVRKNPDRLRLPPKPENYKPFRLCEQASYQTVLNRRKVA